MSPSSFANLLELLATNTRYATCLSGFTAGLRDQLKRGFSTSMPDGFERYSQRSPWTGISDFFWLSERSTAPIGNVSSITTDNRLPRVLNMWHHPRGGTSLEADLRC